MRDAFSYNTEKNPLKTYREKTVETYFLKNWPKFKYLKKNLIFAKKKSFFLFG